MQWFLRLCGTQMFNIQNTLKILMSYDTILVVENFCVVQLPDVEIQTNSVMFIFRQYNTSLRLSLNEAPSCQTLRKHFQCLAMRWF